MKDVIITSYYFYPENTPRAFRTYELARELSKQGYNVKVFIPQYNFDYSEIETDNLKVVEVKSGFLLNRNAKINKTDNSTPKPQQKKSKLRNFFRKFFFGGLTFEFSILLFFKLFSVVKPKSTIISVALPVSPHLSSFLLLLFKSKSVNTIADYGDPFSNNETLDVPSWQKALERRMLNKFNFVTVPHKGAIEAYSFVKDQSKIKVIPQGFDFSNVRLAEYSTNQTVTFGYAGTFYEDIRNPSFLFDYLNTITSNFVFIVFAPKRDTYTVNLLYKYKEILGEKLDIRFDVPREEVIFQLSKMDFMININNITSNTQVPSKLIDYSLAKRPILSIDHKSDMAILNSYFIGDYINPTMVDLNNFDIRLVAAKFIELIELH